MLHQHEMFHKEIAHKQCTGGNHTWILSEWTVLSYLVVTKHLALTRQCRLRGFRDGGGPTEHELTPSPCPAGDSARSQRPGKRSHARGWQGFWPRAQTLHSVLWIRVQMDREQAGTAVLRTGASTGTQLKACSKAHNVNVRETICEHNEGKPHTDAGFCRDSRQDTTQTTAAELVIKLNAEGRGSTAHLKQDTRAQALLLFLLSRS